MRIESTNSAGAPMRLGETGDGSREGGFAAKLKESLAGLAQLQASAASAAETAALGDLSQLHEAVIATQKAGLAFEFAVAVRNQAVEGLQELLRTQV